MTPDFAKHFFDLQKLIVEVRTAQKRFDKSRSSIDQKVAQKLEKQLDEFLSNTNQAERLQIGLFGSAKKPGTPKPLF